MFFGFLYLLYKDSEKLVHFGSFYKIPFLFFLQRNRLIAALSSALLVVEAREKSGTMSTVSHAERYGKPVFAVPGSIYSPDSAGTNRLLHEGRARAACSGTISSKP